LAAGKTFPAGGPLAKKGRDPSGVLWQAKKGRFMEEKYIFR
jgi:hypothetical protein